MRSRVFHLLIALLVTSSLGLAAPPVQQQAPAGAGTATTLSVSPNPSTVSQAITLVARVALAAPGPNAPTGTVEFFDLETSIGTATLSPANSVQTATLEVSSLGAGPHTISARYLGDSQCAASQSSIVAHVVIGH